MLGKVTHQNIHYYLSCLFLFSLPFYRRVATLIFAAIALNWLIGFNWKESFIQLKGNTVAILYLLLYLIIALGVFYSIDKGAALFDLEVKIAFLGVPILFAISFSETRLKSIIKAFTLGCILTTLMCFGLALYEYSLEGIVDVFYYHRLSNWIHPGYLSCYLNFILVLNLYLFVKKRNVWEVKEKIIASVLVVWLITFILLLQARTGYLLLLFTLLGSIYYAIAILRRTKQVLTFLVASIVIGGSAIKMLDFPMKRIQSVKKEITSFSSSDDSGDLSHVSARYFLWQSSINVIKKNVLIGVGPGDVDQELALEYEKRGLVKAKRLNLNSHNQFLQTFLSSGIFGFLTLLFIMVIGIVRGIKNRNVIHLAFMLNFLVFMLFESTLETQYGVLFYTIFCVLLYGHQKQIKNIFK